jgi:hypothetical protein
LCFHDNPESNTKIAKSTGLEPKASHQNRMVVSK